MCVDIDVLNPQRRYSFIFFFIVRANIVSELKPNIVIFKYILHKFQPAASK